MIRQADRSVRCLIWSLALNPSLHESVVGRAASERTTYPLQRARFALRYPPRWPLVNRFRAGYVGLMMRRATRVAAGFIVMMGLALTTMPVQALDANSASIEQLESLNGVGPNTAKNIVQERERAGPFESLEDLSDRVRGIGRKRLGRLRAAGLSVGAGVTVFGPNSVAMPQFAPSLPEATPVAP